MEREGVLSLYIRIFQIKSDTEDCWCFPCHWLNSIFASFSDLWIIAGLSPLSLREHIKIGKNMTLPGQKDLIQRKKRRYREVAAGTKENRRESKNWKEIIRGSALFQELQVFLMDGGDLSRITRTKKAIEENNKPKLNMEASFYFSLWIYTGQI